MYRLLFQDKEFKAKEESLEMSLETLKNLANLRDVIANHGINQAVMAVADPNAELIHFNVYQSLEELPTTSSKGCDQSKVALEAIDDLIKKTVSKVRSDFKAMNGLFKGFFGGVGKFFKAWTTDLDNAEYKLKSTKANEELFLAYNVSILKKEEFSNMGKAISAIMDALDSEKIISLSGEIKALSFEGTRYAKTIYELEVAFGKVLEPLVGNKFVADSLGFRAEMTKHSPIPVFNWKNVNKVEKGTPKSLGWSYDSISEAISDAKELQKVITKTIDELKAMYELCDNIAIMNGDFYHDVTIEKDDDTGEVEISKDLIIVYTGFTRRLYDCCTIIYTLMNKCVSVYFDTYKDTPVDLVKAVIKTGE